MNNPYAASCQTPSTPQASRLVLVFALASWIVTMLYFGMHLGFQSVYTHFQQNPFSIAVDYGCAFLIAAAVGYVTIYKSHPPSNPQLHLLTRVTAGVALSAITWNSEPLANSILNMTRLQYRDNFDVVVMMFGIGVVVTCIVERSTRRLLQTRPRT
jgi:hypothetical protein